MVHQPPLRFDSARIAAAVQKAEADLADSDRPLFRAPAGFLWGAATSGHQTEGNNINSDSWLNETVQPSLFREPSGDACDSYHRYPEDIALAAALGFNCYRVGLEWSRIEPEQGSFSAAALAHYARMLETCHEHGLAPIVTLSHFTVPLWFAKRGGFEMPNGADLFARYAERVAGRLGRLIAAATPFNEANITRLLAMLPGAAQRRPAAEAMIAAAAKASAAPRYSSLLFAEPALTEPVMLDAHAKAYAALKSGPGGYPVGVSLSLQHIEAAEGGEKLAAHLNAQLCGPWLDAARESDFIGVQTYTRVRVGPGGMLPPPPDAEMTDAGYEFYPEALGETIRFAARETGKPVYVTENGIATQDDERRAAFIEQALAAVADCIGEGIDVRSYIHWSLLDNFEWTRGYAEKFGLVSIDPIDFARRVKPSAAILGARARLGVI
jgi:beta-glucosidase